MICVLTTTAPDTDYADRLLLDDGAAAASEIIYKVIREMGVPLDKGMANCLYTGISTGHRLFSLRLCHGGELPHCSGFD